MSGLLSVLFWQHMLPIVFAAVTVEFILMCFMVNNKTKNRIRIRTIRIVKKFEGLTKYFQHI